MMAFGSDVAEKHPRAAEGNRSRLSGHPEQPSGPDSLAGRLFSVLSLAPALALTAWVLVSFPLAALGLFYPAIVIPLVLIGCVILVRLGLSLVRRPAASFSAPWWSVLSTVLISAGFAVFVALTSSEHVIPRRDAGSYIQIGYQLAHHHGLNTAAPLAAFGPSPGNIGFASPAFYQHGDTIIPQFMTGWPSLLGTVDWFAGWGGMLALPAIVGGFAVLAIGGLTARLIGARWAPLAALLVAAAWPVLRVAQSTYSEPLALLLLAAAVCLVIDLIAAGRAADPEGRLVRPIRWHAFAAGLMFAGGELVRLDFGVDFALVVPVIGWLWLHRRPGVRPFVVGAAISGLLAVLDGAFVTEPYIRLNLSSTAVMVAFVLVATIGTFCTVRTLRKRSTTLRSQRWWRPVPALGVAAVLAIGLLLFIRPFISVDHSTTNAGVIGFTEAAQRRLGLPVDGSRGYSERSLWWVSWYVGWPMLAAALLGAAMLTWRLLHGRGLRYLPMVLIYLGATVLTLLRPGITPDHPWADRRLVVEVIPGVILLATWTVASLTRYLWALSRSRTVQPADSIALAGASAAAGPPAGESIQPAGAGALPAADDPARPVGPPVAVGRPGNGAARAGYRVLAWAAPLLLTAAFLVPIGLATGPVATDRTERGELAATTQVCAALAKGESVVLIDGLWAPIIRSQCGLPVSQLLHPSLGALDQLVASIRTTGRTPVIAGSQAQGLQAIGLRPTRMVNLVSRQDQQQLVRRPDGTQPLNLEFWLARP